MKNFVVQILNEYQPLPPSPHPKLKKFGSTELKGMDKKSKTSVYRTQRHISVPK